MASIKQQGNGYLITVSNGYDVNGKQIREYMTWVPERPYTPKQLEKELQRQATLFEETVKASSTKDGGIRFAAFVDIFMRDHGPNLKAKTLKGYEDRLIEINQALGHIPLNKMKPGHISAFYAKLQKSGRRQERAQIKIDFTAWLKEHHTTMAALAKSAGVGIWSLKQLKKGQPIEKDHALKLAQAMGEDWKALFKVLRDMAPLKPGTIHTYHRVLSAILFRAVSWGYIEKNPASRVNLPSIANRKAKFLDEDDAMRLLELLQDEPIKWRTMVMVDLFSGLRRGEFLGLCWPHIDMENCLVTIRQTSNYLPSKGVYTDTPKTDGSFRVQKVSRTTILLLLEYKEWQDAQKAKLGDAWLNQDDRVFTRDNGLPIFPDSITQWFHKFLLKHEFPAGVCIHSLRHTYATLMINDGTPLVVVSRQLGHAQTSTTANIYAHVIRSTEAKAVQVADRYADLALPGWEEKYEKKEGTA